MVEVLQELGLSLPTNMGPLQNTYSHDAAPEQSIGSEGTNPCSSKDFKAGSEESLSTVELKSRNSAEPRSLEHRGKDSEACKQPKFCSSGNSIKCYSASGPH